MEFVAIIGGVLVGIAASTPFLLAVKRGDVSSGLKAILISFAVLSISVIALKIAASELVLLYGVSSVLSFLICAALITLKFRV